MAYRRCCCCWIVQRFRTDRPRKCSKCKRARCGGELCDVETLRTRDKTATPPASWSRDQIRRVAALEELRKDLTWWEWWTSQPDGPDGVQVPMLDVYLARADVRDLVERRREAARIRSGYYDDRPTWQRPVW